MPKPRQIVIPREVLVAEIRAGRITASGEALKALGGVVGAVGGAVGAVAEWRATEKLAEAGAEPAGAELAFPPGCCNCLRDGMQVRSIPMTSTVGRGVEYTFRLRVPHCRECAVTANRKRPSFAVMVGGFVAISLLSLTILIAVGTMTGNDSLLMASFVVAPLTGFALPRLWMRLRRPKSGQASRYQAVYVSSIYFDALGRPSDFTLAFENPKYAERFLSLNEKLGVSEV